MPQLVQILKVIGVVPEVENMCNNPSEFFQKLSVGTILSEVWENGYVNVLNKNTDDLELFSQVDYAKMMVENFEYRRIV